jgi:short subunit dehydrogenase-like uncharacterized protein
MGRQREFDLILWGATGFTGQLVAKYLFDKFGSTGKLRWAIAGRSLKKLQRVRMQHADASLAIILADSMDEASLSSMVQRTKVVCTTVGPYSIYGLSLVSNCVQHNTHYCDLCGEVPWMRKVIDTYHDQASQNGTKIVHCCGFDSIPSDLGVYFAQQSAMSQKGVYADEIHMRVIGIRGGISGGTYASLEQILKAAQRDKAVAQLLQNPYGLNPNNEYVGLDETDLNKIAFDEFSKSWIGPFVMAGINTRVVRRSNALFNHPYGNAFRYSEASSYGAGWRGKFIASMMSLPLLLFTARPGSILKRIADFIFPKPGQGPSKRQRNNGYFKLRFFMIFKDSTKAQATVAGDMDPGYGSTAKMLSEVALCLALDDLPELGGCLTPSVAMGNTLKKRLEENAGLSFDFKLT